MKIHMNKLGEMCINIMRQNKMSLDKRKKIDTTTYYKDDLIIPLDRFPFNRIYAHHFQ